ncbi:hypothetical protein EV363DRAFT_1403448 [Boletus edulis]|nr:hypothetical protein EV363DRAFT_1403448 [Boletus edulis]
MTSKTIGRTGVLEFILTYAEGQMQLSRFSGGHFKFISKPFHTVMLGVPPGVFSSTHFFPLGRTKFIQHSFSTWEGWTFQP